MGSRLKRAKLNIIIPLSSQIIKIVCGLILPRLFISQYGSEINGAVTSITQFLSYITLLEAGVGGIVRSVLYGPIARNERTEISKILNEIKIFFSFIGFVFLAYVIVLALSFKSISHITCLNWISTALLVIIISLSTFAEYFIGISYSILLQSLQKQYVTNLIGTIATVLNVLLTIVLIRMDSTIFVVKLASSIVFVLKPIILSVYVKRTYVLPKVNERNKQAISQKWEGLWQHIAYVLHSHTDVVVLTIFKSLSFVSIYSVYNMVASSLQSLISSFSGGMEAIFGDMLAKKEMEKLNTVFGCYETFISITTITLFSVASSLITPFICIYTANITDANYNQYIFGVLLTFSCALFCLRLPYHSMVFAAGSFRQTRMGAFGEAIANILVSILLVGEYDLIGVAIGTIVAVLVRFIYYVFYLSRNVICRSVILFLKRMAVNIFPFIFTFCFGFVITQRYCIDSYLKWGCVGLVLTLFSLFVNFIFNGIFYRDDIRYLLNKMKR